MDLRFLRLRRWLLKQQPNKTVFNRFIKATPHNSARSLRQDFCPNSKFGKRRNTVCTRKGHARIRMAPLSPTAATYFSFFKPPDWRKRSVVRGRGFIQRFPNVPKQIRVRTHGENCGSWMSNPVFMSLAELHWQHWRCLAGWRGFTASMRSVRVA